MLKGHLIEKIHSPEDLKTLTIEQLNSLCDEIRENLVNIVSKNGGHLASNLGVVELTVALHKVYSTPVDQIVWDVGHQSYTHKMLTGRQEALDTIRKEGGLSGFPKRCESEHDSFNSGHSSTSISAATGLAYAKQLKNEDGTVISVIGDGALTGGLAYEGLNNAGRLKRNFVVVLNDNKMSISRNVGAVARHLSGIRSKRGYLRLKYNTEKFLQSIPLVGKQIRNTLFRSKLVLKKILYVNNNTNNIFSSMGFIYFGPIDGHDLKKLIDVFEAVKEIDQPVLIHITTKKGKGYVPAEINPGTFHGISSFDIETGETSCSSDCYSDIFGKTLVDLAKQDKNICAITAAMKLGTGLKEFSQLFRSRFFDVGIAEGHAVTFAAGLSANGMIPVFAVYSSFLQRSYDQILHDAATQKLKVILGIDRAGFVGEDGETHQGLFDVPLLNSIPGVTVYSPCYYDELSDSMKKAAYDVDGVVAVRYHRGVEPKLIDDFIPSLNSYDLYGEENSKVILVTYGRTFAYAAKAKQELTKKGINVSVLKLNRIKPIDDECINIALKKESIYFFEEGMHNGGTGEHFASLLVENNFKGKINITAVNDEYVTQASVERSMEKYKLDVKGIEEIVIAGEQE